MAFGFSHLLLAFDDSVESRVALQYACAIARTGARLTVAHAVDEIRIVATALTADGFASATDPGPLIDAVDGRGKAVLAAAVDACALAGVTAQAVFVDDAAAAGLAKLERESDVDLVVVGTHGRAGLRRALLGSVAERIVRAGRLPALVVPGDAKLPRHGELFARAFVALDDSAPAHAAMSLAARMSAGGSVHLVLGTVIDSRDLQAKAQTYQYDVRPFEAGLHARAADVLERAKSAGSTATIDDLVIVEGEPAERIDHIALQRNCDLIVIGSHLRQGIERFAFGSVAETVIRHASVPVLVVPADELHAASRNSPER